MPAQQSARRGLQAVVEIQISNPVCEACQKGPPQGGGAGYLQNQSSSRAADGCAGSCASLSVNLVVGRREL